MGNAFAHFSGSLIGKRERKNVKRVNTILHQVSNAIGKHARFPRSGTCNNHCRAIGVLHGFYLRGIQFFQIIHGKILNTKSVFQK